MAKVKSHLRVVTCIFRIAVTIQALRCQDIPVQLLIEFLTLHDV